MIMLSTNESVLKDFPTMTRAELDQHWLEAKERFDQALAVKLEADRDYQAAANELNALERLVKKMDKRNMLAQREAIRLMRREG